MRGNTKYAYRRLNSFINILFILKSLNICFIRSLENIVYVYICACTIFSFNIGYNWFVCWYQMPNANKWPPKLISKMQNQRNGYTDSGLNKYRICILMKQQQKYFRKFVCRMKITRSKFPIQMFKKLYIFKIDKNLQ